MLREERPAPSGDSDTLTHSGSEFRLRVPADPVALGFVRRAVDGLRDLYGDPTIDDLALILSELVTNGIRHASSEFIEICLDFGSDAIRGTVSDRGVGFAVGDRSEVPRLNGGYGLQIVGRLSPRWGVDTGSGRTEVWFEL
jgi:serine/threonine-protein kinase RsbW